MTRDSQIRLFADRIDAVVRSTAAEFDVSAVEAAGVLEVIKADIIAGAVALRRKERSQQKPPQAGQPPDSPT
jgi:hypothetical protein